MHLSRLRLAVFAFATAFATSVVNGASATDAVLDGYNLSIDSPDYDKAANVSILDVVPNGNLLEVTIVLRDNKSTEVGPDIKDVEGNLTLTTGGKADIVGAFQIGGEGTFVDLVIQPTWARFKGILALGQENTYRFDVLPNLSSGGPFNLQTIFVSEGMQPHGYKAEVPRFEARDAFGFYYDGDLIEPIHSGDLAMSQAFELLDDGESQVPVFMASVMDAGLPVDLLLLFAPGIKGDGMKTPSRGEVWSIWTSASKRFQPGMPTEPDSKATVDRWFTPHTHLGVSTASTRRCATTTSSRCSVYGCTCTRKWTSGRTTTCASPIATWTGRVPFTPMRMAARESGSVGRSCSRTSPR